MVMPRRSAESLMEERTRLVHRLAELQREAANLQRENLTLKMKTTIQDGAMRLQIDSLQEDRQIWLDKCLELQEKVKESRSDLTTKEHELDALRETTKDGGPPEHQQGQQQQQRPRSLSHS